MNNYELSQLLIDYAEGTLDAAGKSRIEEALRNSHRLRTELAALRTTFGLLQHLDEESVPNHYFTNFLPRVRERLVRKRMFHRMSVPLWLQKVSAPLLTSVIIMAMYGMYNLFKPDSSRQILASLVQETEQRELEQLMTTVAPFELSAASMSSSSTILNSQFLAEELLATSSLYDNVVSDVQILSQLDEQDVEMIVLQLGTGSVQ